MRILMVFRLTLGLRSVMGDSSIKRTRHDRAAVGAGTDGKLSADLPSAVTHNAQADTGFRLALGHADAVVGNFQRDEGPFAIEAEADVSRLAVLEGIGHRLLGNAEELRGREVVVDGDGRLAGKIA